MDVTPKYIAVGDLFKFEPAYRVPAYQRSYSWEELEIEDFIRDLETCYNKRKYDTAVVHFFGQIVCIQDKMQGTHDLTYYELVDGQQRIATFILLVLALKEIYKSIIVEINGDVALSNQVGILNVRIADIDKRYLYFQKEILEEFQELYVVELSNRDKNFFRGFLKDIEFAVERESHKLIKGAYQMIYSKINALTTSPNLRDRLGNLKMIEQILENDFYLLNMVTGDRKAAFKLFQVLNNRGKNLTEGDLLRAESLRLLEPFVAQQAIVEDAWDNILADIPLLTERFLRAIYGSYTGKKAGANSLFNEFLDYFLPQYELENVEPNDANNIQLTIKKIENDISILRKINNGLWPYDQRQPIEHWDRNRIHLLIHAFDHIECLPYLLSANMLDHQKFNQIVNILERFVFRYVIVCNQYIGSLISIYHEEAKIIRDDPDSYEVNSLTDKLKPLEDLASADMFSRLLDDLKFHKIGKSNKPLKYFLLNTEYYWRWYIDGANGQPACLDKERVYDFGDSTIEHIYPHNASGAVVVSNIEPLKNTIGNLTILGNNDNRAADSDNFETKRVIFENSSLMINRDIISVVPDWNKEVIEARTISLKQMAETLYRI